MDENELIEWLEEQIVIVREERKEVTILPDYQHWLGAEEAYQKTINQIRRTR